MDLDLQSRFRGCLLGLAVGDALGASVEFYPRGGFEPLSDMIGGGHFNLLPGQWTDDTSMALCLATSLLECDGFEALDQMERYCRWVDTGYLSSTGYCFDLGGTVANALSEYRRSGNPFAGSSHPHSAGNGCIMRIAPIPMFFYPDPDLVGQYAIESCRTTHGAKECLDASWLFARMILRALLGCTKDEVTLGDKNSFLASEKVMAIARAAYQNKQRENIRGSGYVVESLEAAMWCFIHTERFEEAVLMAANLGDDADTTAAVCGQLAGAYYGVSAIPSGWLEKLTMREEITNLADRLWQRHLRATS